jgi:hypothetical protein
LILFCQYHLGLEMFNDKGIAPVLAVQEMAVVDVELCPF